MISQPKNKPKNKIKPIKHLVNANKKGLITIQGLILIWVSTNGKDIDLEKAATELEISTKAVWRGLLSLQEKGYLNITKRTVK